mmetsp:Transcript_390/g.494  ORF Transcript_390/g.494 Transcript_390/m.494 type:complete len:255 (-) Transcript_390:84-848(-)
MKSILFVLLAIAITMVDLTIASVADDDDSDDFPFAPPTSDFCAAEEQLDEDGDVYISFFKPCTFTFYKKSDPSIVSTDDSFSCDGIANSSNYEIIDSEPSPVIGWPDTCVVNGPRCYNLTEYPYLSNFTLRGIISNQTEIEMLSNFTKLGIFSNFTQIGIDSNLSMVFPSEADFVSVDCASDYAIAQEELKKLPEELEPLAEAFMFFALMVLAGCIVICGICCCCLCGGGRRSGYSKIGGVYAGPPVEAKKIIV